jgi:hypothetical protein
VGVGVLGDLACVEFGFMQECVDCIKPNWRKSIKPNWARVHKAELGASDERRESVFRGLGEGAAGDGSGGVAEAVPRGGDEVSSLAEDDGEGGDGRGFQGAPCVEADVFGGGPVGAASGCVEVVLGGGGEGGGNFQH